MIEYTIAMVMVGSSLVGCISGALGGFAVLRKQSLLGDSISHAALPGIAIAFLITLTKNPVLLMAGAMIAGWISTLLVMAIVKRTIVKEDAALGMILSVFFGFGLVLLTIIQRLPTSNKSGLNHYLFGSAATLLASDIKLMAVLSVITVIGLLLFWKEFKILSFDSDYAISLGYNVNHIELILTFLTVTAIVIGLQTVGVILMSAMIIAPASAARQWTNRLGVMIALSALFGAISGLIGATISSQVDRLPTGPTIVLVMSAFVAISMVFAPAHGLIWKRNRRS
ncbi:metal ABC transporter permease [bacterium]|nr:metal ABC transporter permease [bacterium]